MKNNIIISVESRKGGVGKTTAALSISKILLENGYSVLLIDADITGTNIANCEDSPFWSDSMNILKISSNKEELLNANILSLFEDSFMNGNEIPSFQDKNIMNSFCVNLNRINILGSQIYSPDGKPTTICSPSVLFDQLHGYWFVDFLKELIEDFEAAIKNRPIAVVLDNSPGYVGIAPAIQDWLTDLGPEIGKFLLVTSLDNQDMQSCAVATSVLHELYRKKWNTSRMFLEAKNGNGENLDYSSMTGDFFVKLTEYDESLDKNSNRFPVPFAFYNDKKKPGSDYLDSPHKYLGVIVNRVPKTVLKHRRTYRPELYIKDFTFLNLLGGHYSREWGKFMVGYNPYIEYQFMQSGMSKIHSRRKWSSNLDKLLMRNKKMFYAKDFLYITDFSPKIFHLMNNYIRQFQEIIDTALDTMRTNGLDYLADLIDEDWQPKSIVRNMKTTFYSYMTNLDHPIFNKIYWDDFEDERMMEKKGLYRLYEVIHMIDIPLNNNEEYIEIQNIIFYLIASLPLPLKKRGALEDDILEFFQTLIQIEANFIKGDQDKYNDLPRILSTKIKSKMINEEMLHDFKFSNRVFHGAENNIIEFFLAFTSAQARLMKLPEDSQFLLWLIQTMVKYEYENHNALPYVRKLAEDVILHKSLSYHDVREKSLSALSEAQYFVDFDEVIRNIIERWGLER